MVRGGFPFPAKNQEDHRGLFRVQRLRRVPSPVSLGVSLQESKDNEERLYHELQAVQAQLAQARD